MTDWRRNVVDRFRSRTLFYLIGISALMMPRLCLAQSYTITTVAGGGNPYFSPGAGDGGPATNAALGNPTNDVAVDGGGNLFIAAGTLVRKVSQNGIISTVAGGGSSVGDGVQATQAALSPVAITVDSTNNLYIADTAFGLYRVRRVDTKGVITTVAGGSCCSLGDGGPATDAYLAVPYGLAVAGGSLYIAQVDGQGDNLIRKVSANGVINTVAGGGQCCASGDGGTATSVGLARPTGVAVDAGGNLYIAEASGNRIRRVSPGGTITTVAVIEGPWHVALDGTANIYVTQINDASVRLIRPDGSITTIAGNGTHGFSGDGGPATSATIDRPAGIVVGNRGQVYITDASFGINRVRLLTMGTGQLSQPLIAPGGVVPIFSSSNTIQPGSWVSIYGTNLASATTVWNGDFPTSLGGTSVTVNSKPAYLWFVSPTQVNFQAPSDTTTGTVKVILTTSAGSATSSVTLNQYAPSFNLLNNKYATATVPTPGSPGNSGAGYDVIGPAGVFSFPTRPVKAGETLVLYGVGFGPTNPSVTAGQPFSGGARSVTVPQISIGGTPATVTFAGIILSGLFQFNVIVPNVGSGDKVLQATVGGATTPNDIFITVQ